MAKDVLTNKNDMTWTEWRQAAGYHYAKDPWYQELKKAWLQGEDPADYRAGAPKRTDFASLTEARDSLRNACLGILRSADEDFPDDLPSSAIARAVTKQVAEERERYAELKDLLTERETALVDKVDDLARWERMYRKASADRKRLIEVLSAASTVLKLGDNDLD